MVDNKKGQSQEEKKGETEKEEIKGQDKMSFIWIILGIGAVLLIWLLSSWIYK